MLNIAGLTVEKLQHLVNVHVNRYGNMLRRAARGDRGFRPDELKYLLKTWESIRDQLVVRGGEIQLEKHERNEVIDAFQDEDWDAWEAAHAR